ncbi:MAG: phosphonate ABC transporter ATP-binding protein [Verrucomicrobiae bacterium]|nr:phosphonate ABC transporter ATP-binding protein [Verrucomicrobiae bacterium]NNJ87209.1 phosphonate ABC transporter ATP-binding protein [Akkermansiaceae bacterium]
MSIQIDGLTHRYGSTTALSDISLGIEKGEQVALIGPSGCGKTTLLKLLGTQLEPTEGQLSVLGQEPDKLKSEQLRQLRTSIASIPQHLGLVPNVRVIRNVLNGKLGETTFIHAIRQLFFLTKQEQEKAYKILKRTGIGDKIYDRTDSLSGGQQQRVAVARALYQKPVLILADEPVSAIDPARARDMIQLLTTLSAEDGDTLVVSLHNLELAREFFPRLIGLRHGMIEFDKAPDELTDDECTSLYQIKN